MDAVTGLLGSVDKEGGPIAAAKIPVKGIPKYDGYKDELAKKHSKFQKIDQRGYKEFPAMKKGKSGGGVVTNNVATAMLDKDHVRVPEPDRPCLAGMGGVE